MPYSGPRVRRISAEERPRRVPALDNPRGVPAPAAYRPGSTGSPADTPAIVNQAASIQIALKMNIPG